MINVNIIDAQAYVEAIGSCAAEICKRIDLRLAGDGVKTPAPATRVALRRIGIGLNAMSPVASYLLAGTLAGTEEDL